MDTQQPANIDTTSSPEWAALTEHQQQMQGLHLRELFAEQPNRGTEFRAQAADLYIDYSKHRITRETLSLLMALTGRAGLRAKIDAMFAGKHINTTENRAVLHTALRQPKTASLV
ncbi:MAG: glucose-6-phosphate isomerase, partial [Antricoccus sp.]